MTSASSDRLGRLLVHLYQGDDSNSGRSLENDYRGLLLLPCLGGATYADLVTSLEWRLSQFFVAHGPHHEVNATGGRGMLTDAGEASPEEEEETVPLLPQQTQRLASSQHSHMGEEGDDRLVPNETNGTYFCPACRKAFGEQQVASKRTGSSLQSPEQWNICVDKIALKDKTQSTSLYTSVSMEGDNMDSPVPLDAELQCFFSLSVGTKGSAKKMTREDPLLGNGAGADVTSLALPSRLTVQIGDAVVRVGAGLSRRATLMDTIVPRLLGNREDRKPTTLHQNEVPLPVPIPQPKADPGMFFVDSATGACILPCERVAVVAALVSSIRVERINEGTRSVTVGTASNTRSRGSATMPLREPASLGFRGEHDGVGSVISMSEYHSVQEGRSDDDDRVASSYPHRVRGDTDSGLLHFPLPDDFNEKDECASRENSEDGSLMAFTFGYETGAPGAHRDGDEGCFGCGVDYNQTSVRFDMAAAAESSENSDADFIYRPADRKAAAPSSTTQVSSVPTVVNRSMSKSRRLETSETRRSVARRDASVESDSLMVFGFEDLEDEDDNDDKACGEVMRADASTDRMMPPQRNGDAQETRNNASTAALPPPITSDDGMPMGYPFRAMDTASETSNSVHLAQRPVPSPPPMLTGTHEGPSNLHPDATGNPARDDGACTPVLAPKDVSLVPPPVTASLLPPSATPISRKRSRSLPGEQTSVTNVQEASIVRGFAEGRAHTPPEVPPVSTRRAHTPITFTPGEFLSVPHTASVRASTAGTPTSSLYRLTEGPTTERRPLRGALAQPTDPSQRYSPGRREVISFTPENHKSHSLTLSQRGGSHSSLADEASRSHGVQARENSGGGGDDSEEESSESDMDGPITLSSARPLRSMAHVDDMAPQGSLAFVSTSFPARDSAAPSQATQSVYMTPRQGRQHGVSDTVPGVSTWSSQHNRQGLLFDRSPFSHRSGRYPLASPLPPAPSPLQVFHPVVRPPSQTQETPVPAIMVTQQELPDYIFAAADDSDEEEDVDEGILGEDVRDDDDEESS